MAPSEGYAGVHVKESSNITIKNNTFTNLSDVDHMHGVYMYRTTKSKIQHNTFSRITGDAVRLGDRSSNNIVENDTISRSGKSGAISEWGRLAPIGSEKCGGGKAGPLTWNNCKKASIKNGGGNKKI
ncbi:hypothetical protein D0T12_22090 [Actinomadura spongiicola]|uniref:Right handed beta helix domain-containing protein n=1 Tax=Actinomadura spongiicola TaxID=2303421 RepID=A0A372GEA7_9ACTN|nr:right-handed parallel beta-helix repeat-containing protein [Actinomadura spongiicola]RFS83706.1 hypothetical protein D0T12_22090 [Actinomadura spongiicola]